MTTPISLNDLVRRIEALEKKLGVSPLPPHQPIPYNIPIKEEGKTICQVCGVNWSGVMSYSCGNYKCPIQPKVTC